jgi:hypothetical protein
VNLWCGGLTLRRAGVLATQLPAGARIWQATGGPKAWSDEYHALMVVQWRVQILEWRQTEDGQKGKNAPVLQEPPPFVGDEQKKAHTADVKAREWMRRQQAIEARQLTEGRSG